LLIAKLEEERRDDRRVLLHKPHGNRLVTGGLLLNECGAGFVLHKFT
jgi:hypothetical protein